MTTKKIANTESVDNKPEKPRINWGTPSDRELIRRLIDRAIGGKHRSPLPARELLAAALELWFSSRNRMEHGGRQWLVWSRSDWAVLAGLTEHETKDTALPALRKLPFIEIRVKPVRMRHKVWISVKEQALAAAIRDVLNLTEPQHKQAKKGMTGAQKRSLIYRIFAEAFGDKGTILKAVPKPKFNHTPIPAKSKVSGQKKASHDEVMAILEE